MAEAAHDISRLDPDGDAAGAREMRLDHTRGAQASLMGP